MSQNQYCRMMSVFIGMFLMITMMSQYNVAASRNKDFEISKRNNYQSLKHLRRLMHKLRQNDDEELYFEARADPIGDCTADIVDGYKWNGESIRGLMGIDTVQRCMDSCDAHTRCVGWNYNPSTKICWSYSSITGIVKMRGVKSGSCVGTSIKAKCTEKVDGAYASAGNQEIQDVATPEDCMAKCDQLDICVGWYHITDEKKCVVFNIIGGLSQNYGVTTGSCLAPQKRYRPEYSLDDFRRDSLRRHNRKRKEHCTPELALDDNLNQISQNLADQLAAADVTPPASEPATINTIYFNKADAAISGAYTVDCFYDEYKYYKYDAPDQSVATNFPKVIWKSSKLMGSGRAFTSDQNTMFVVTTYDWQGDMSASMKDNVLPKQTDCQ